MLIFCLDKPISTNEAIALVAKVINHWVKRAALTGPEDPEREEISEVANWMNSTLLLEKNKIGLWIAVN